MQNKPVEKSNKVELCFKTGVRTPRPLDYMSIKVYKSVNFVKKCGGKRF